MECHIVELFLENHCFSEQTQNNRPLVLPLPTANTSKGLTITMQRTLEGHLQYGKSYVDVEHNSKATIHVSHYRRACHDGIYR